MRLSNSFIRNLIESDEPTGVIWDEMIKIWEPQDSLKEHYSQEINMKQFEELLLKIYFEYFSDVLPKKCIEYNISSSDNRLLFLDALSLREATLLVKRLRKEGLEVDLSYGFSSVPSITTAFKKQINLNSNKVDVINDHNNILVTGKPVIWSRFPDVLLDKIQSGTTVISSLEKMYKITEKITLTILKQVEGDLVITSDHGYLRTEGGYVFGISDDMKKKIKNYLGNSRYKEMTQTSPLAEELVKLKYAVRFNGYYLMMSRYVTPVAGSYSIYPHGSISLMECITPKITIRRG